MPPECGYLMQDTKKVLAVLAASIQKSLQINTPVSVFDDVKRLQEEGLKTLKGGSSVFQVVGQGIERAPYWNRAIATFGKSAKALKATAPQLQEHMKAALELKDSAPSTEACDNLLAMVQAIPEYNASVGQTHVLELDTQLVAAINAHAAQISSAILAECKNGSDGVTPAGTLEAYTGL
eukprot:543967-Pyramimonas_sp.AAC.1